MDKLDRIFKLQKELDEILREKRDLVYPDEDAETREEWIQKLGHAMIAEVIELIDLSNWKWWVNRKDVDYERVRDELVDILHFWVSLCLKLGISPEDIFETYKRKNLENRMRQEGKVKGREDYRARR